MSGLRIPSNTHLGIGETGAQNIEQTWTTASYVEEQVKSIGIADYTQPTFPCPVLLPETFNTADAEYIKNTYLHLNAWYSYITELLSKVQLYIIEHENMLTQLEAQTRDSYRQMSKAGEKMTLQEIADRVILNPQHRNLARTLQQYKQYKDRLQTRADSIGRSMRMLSRQIEVRRQDLEQTMGITRQGYDNRDYMGPVRGRFGA